MSEHEADHTHTETKRILNRISRAAGHMKAVGRMVEEGRDCSDVLIQLAAVRSAVNGIGKLVLSDHMTHCVAQAVERGDMAALEKLNAAIDKFLK